ncbi:toll/interleukin-1 receptor domain-containing protein [Actinomadura gamaensis]|uniref:Toll/interleukin-1 receptor domain-containing protein n=1 Tax=Actinomadura gamaensis TaxID=1763541 RepID=A0ABV9TTC4_9ACTN
MNEVFINYRTGDGDEAAAFLENALSHRFGSEAIFRAAKSIPPGKAFDTELLTAVRAASVLLAIIGPGWATDERLRDPGDWVRREILEARAARIPVIPVLKGRTSGRLRADDLPAELAYLAGIQSLRLDMRDNGADVQRIGDVLATLVPRLRTGNRQMTDNNHFNAGYGSNVGGQFGRFEGNIGQLGGTISNVTHADSNDLLALLDDLLTALDKAHAEGNLDPVAYGAARAEVETAEVELGGNKDGRGRVLTAMQKVLDLVNGVAALVAKADAIIAAVTGRR